MTAGVLLRPAMNRQPPVRTFTPTPGPAPVSRPFLQRKCDCDESAGLCPDCLRRDLRLQRSPRSAGPTRASMVWDGEKVPSLVYDVLRSPGRPLDPVSRVFMEARLGHDFSQVRVHTGTRAAESARAVNALAYTVGHDVVFRAGQYAPATVAGQRLLAHELTHVVQQSAAPEAHLQLGSPHDVAEGEAAKASASIATGTRLSVSRRGMPVCVMRQPEGRPPEQQQEEEGPGFWGTVGGGLMGEFKEDPNFAMIGVDVGVSLVPILDQASDIRDIIAHLYYLIFRRQYDRFMRWLGLVFTLIGLIPEVGSAIKGASKFIIRGVREVIAHLADILRPLRRFFPELTDLGRLGAYVSRNWSRFVASGMSAWNSTINRVSTIVNAIPGFLTSGVRVVREGLARIRQVAPTKLRAAFDWVRRQWENIIEQVRARLGRERGPLAGATEGEIEAALAHIDVPPVTGGARPTIGGHRVPTRRVPRLEATDIPTRPGERLADAIGRIRSIIGRQLSDYPEIQAAWNRAAAQALQGRTLTPQNARQLYDRTRDLFWQEIRNDPAAAHRFADAGFILPAGDPRRAVQLGGVGPGVPPQEITVSLDHVAEIAQGNNWTRALDPTNLKFEFSAPNSFREIIQMRHSELRPSP